MDLVDFFSFDFAARFLKYIEINNYSIKLIYDQQQYHKSIYRLELVKQKTFKTYNKINLANDLIRFFKSFVRVAIFFVKKLNKNL